jgi:peptidoglycan/xylan/chitin deacetylase (PgdA/CDA1 family)
MKELLVLCYHGVSESWPAETTVTPADFESHMTYLVERGYAGSTFSEALTAPPGDRTVVVTFDDAHLSVLEHAVPVLERLGMPATMFVPTDYPDSGRLLAWEGCDVWLGTEHEHELRCMGWDDLRALAAAGWEIGSHSCSHPRLKRLDDERLAAELTASRLECERRLGVPCRSFAYPRGSCDDRLARAARDSGYLFAAAVAHGPAPQLPYRWPRLALRRGEGRRRLARRIAARRLRPSFVHLAAARTSRPRRSA